MPLSLMHRQYIPSARMVILFLLLLIATGVARAATFSVTTPGQQTLTNRFLPYAGSGTQLIGNSPAWRDSAGVLGINNYLEGLETLTPAAAVNLNFSTWRTKRITLNQNTIFTAINIPSASTNVQTMLLEVIGDGAFMVSFANVTWQTPEITTPEAGVVTLYALRGDNGAVKGYTQAVAASGVTTINPTDGYLPYRSNATTFADSPLIVSASTNVSNIGRYLSLDGLETNPTYSFTNATGLGYFRDGTGASGFAEGGIQIARLTTSAFDITTNSFIGWSRLPGTTTSTVTIGLTNSSGGNGDIVFAANSAWTARINQNSGYTGGGTLFLSDDGTYKAAGGSPLWSSSSGNLTPSPAVDVVSIQSQSADNATNVAMVVDTDALWTDGVLLNARNAGTNWFKIGPKGGITRGPNTETLYGLAVDEMYLQANDVSKGDPDTIEFFVGVNKDSTGDVSGAVNFYAKTNIAYFSITSDIVSLGGGPVFNAYVETDKATNGISFVNLYDWTNTRRWNVEPTTAATTTPYLMDTSRAHTSGNLLEVANNGTNKVTVDWQGNVTANGFIAGSTNAVGELANKVTGAASSTDNDLMAFSSTSGKLAKVSTSAGTLGDNSSATYALTFNVSGTDPVLTAGSGTLTSSAQLIVPDGVAATPGLRGSDTDTGLTFDTVSSGRVVITAAGTQMAFFDASRLNINVLNNCLLLRSVYLGNDNGAEVLQIGADAAIPIAQTAKGPDGSGSDKAGGNLTLGGGKSTGTGRGGDLITATSLTAAGTSSTQNALSTRYQAVAKAVDLTGGAATAFQKFTMATNNYAGMEIVATVRASDAAFAMQSLTSVLKIDAVNVGGTNSVQVTQVDNTLAQIPAGGTLTCTYDAIDEGSNVFSIRANAASSLTETILRVKWVITALNSSDAITVTPQ